MSARAARTARRGRNDAAPGAEHTPPGAAAAPAPPLGRLPTVDLLPPDVRAKRVLRGVRRRCALVLGVVVVLSAAACFWGIGDRVLAEAEQQEASRESDRLLAELATYSDVVRVQSDIARTRTAIAYGMRNEVLWSELVLRFETALPDFARIESMNISIVFDAEHRTADEADPFVTDDSIGEIDWVISVPVLAQSGDLIPAIDAAEGLFGTTFTRVERVEEAGEHRVTGSVLLHPSLRSERFTETDEEEAA